MRSHSLSAVVQRACCVGFKAPVLGHDGHRDELDHLKTSRNQCLGIRGAMTAISAVPSPGFPSETRGGLLHTPPSALKSRVAQ